MRNTLDLAHHGRDDSYVIVRLVCRQIEVLGVHVLVVPHDHICVWHVVPIPTPGGDHFKVWGMVDHLMRPSGGDQHGVAAVLLHDLTSA